MFRILSFRYFHHAKISLFNFFEKKTNNIHCTCSKILEFLKVSFQNRYWYFKATHSSLSKNIISRVLKEEICTGISLHTSHKIGIVTLGPFGFFFQPVIQGIKENQ